MKWRRFVSPFILIPVIAGLLGNISLGLVIVGLTGLVWGLGTGSLFISITTTILVILTGNINMEIIFLYTLSMAYLIREEHILVFLDRKLIYIGVFIISISVIPFWKYLLGHIPAGLLNEFNISGGLLVLAGLLLFTLRGRLLLKNHCNGKEFLEYLLIFISSVQGLLGSIHLVPMWILGSIALKLVDKLQFKLKIKSRLFTIKSRVFLLTAILLILAAIASNILLPISFLSGILLLLVFFIIFQNIRQIPLVEMVYISMILGIVASRMGLLL